MATAETEEITENHERPFSVPGFMYAFFCFVGASLFLFFNSFLSPEQVFLKLLFLVPAIALVTETVFLLFLQPTVFVGEDSLRFKGSRRSVWERPPRLFAWGRSDRDEEFDLDEFEALVLDYTQIPFPVPFYPVAETPFSMTRWLLTIRHKSGTCYLLEMTGSPESIREMALEAREDTGLPLRTPWTEPDALKEGRGWSIVPDDGAEVQTSWDPSSFGEDAMETESGDERVVIDAGRTPGLVSRIAGVLFSLLILIAGVGVIFYGLNQELNPAGLFASIGYMVGGIVLVTGSILLFANVYTDTTRRIILSSNDIQDATPLKQSTRIPFDRINRINAVYEDESCSGQYGLGKDLPLLEIYSDEDRLLIPVSQERVLDRFQELFGKVFPIQSGASNQQT